MLNPGGYPYAWDWGGYPYGGLPLWVDYHSAWDWGGVTLMGGLP